jgi:hypothetical protein
MAKKKKKDEEQEVEQQDCPVCEEPGEMQDDGAFRCANHHRWYPSGE